MKFSAPIVLLAGLVAVVSGAAIDKRTLEKRTPPNIPTKAQATTMLAALATRVTDATGYDRFVSITSFHPRSH